MHESSAHTRSMMRDRLTPGRAAARLTRSLRGVATSPGRRWWIGGAALIILAAAVLGRDDLALMARSFADADWGWAAVALALMLVSLALRSLSLQLIVNALGEAHARFTEAFSATSIGLLANSLIPVKRGDGALAVRAVRAAAPEAGASAVPDGARPHADRADVRHRHLPRHGARVPLDALGSGVGDQRPLRERGSHRRTARGRVHPQSPAASGRRGVRARRTQGAAHGPLVAAAHREPAHLGPAAGRDRRHRDAGARLARPARGGGRDALGVPSGCGRTARGRAGHRAHQSHRARPGDAGQRRDVPGGRRGGARPRMASPRARRWRMRSVCRRCSSWSASWPALLRSPRRT